MRNRFKPFVPIILIFVILNAFFIAGKSMLQRWNADADVLVIGNTLLFVITFISYVMSVKGLHSPNPHHFVRSVYSSILIKLFVCMIGALVYIAIYQKDLNKPALFGCMGLYLVYTFTEVSILTRLLKSQKG